MHSICNHSKSFLGFLYRLILTFEDQTTVIPSPFLYIPHPPFFLEILVVFSPLNSLSLLCHIYYFPDSPSIRHSPRVSLHPLAPNWPGCLPNGSHVIVRGFLLCLLRSDAPWPRTHSCFLLRFLPQFASIHLQVNSPKMMGGR